MTTFEPVAQHFVGLRLFLVDESTRLDPMPDAFAGGRGASGYGLLRSPYQQSYRWGPGVNEATCYQRSLEDLARTLGMAPTPASRHLDEARAAGHPSVPAPSCQCGFWACTSNVHLMSLPVLREARLMVGVVHAWGRTVVGDKGFRSEKARIVALGDVAQIVAEREPQRWWCGWPWEMVKNILLGRRPPRPLLGGSWTWLGSGAIHLFVQVSESARVRPLSDDLMRAVRARYPDADYFRSLPAMLDSHPLSDLSGLTGDVDAVDSG